MHDNIRSRAAIRTRYHRASNRISAARDRWCESTPAQRVYVDWVEGLSETENHWFAAQEFANRYLADHEARRRERARWKLPHHGFGSARVSREALTSFGDYFWTWTTRDADEVEGS